MMALAPGNGFRLRFDAIQRKAWLCSRMAVYVNVKHIVGAAAANVNPATRQRRRMPPDTESDPSAACRRTASMNPLESQLDYPFGDAMPESGAVHEIVPGLLWLRMGLPFALNHINLWLLEDELD